MTDFEAPSTYAEWYWATQLDVFMAQDERYEKVLSPIAANIFDMIPDDAPIPPAISMLFQNLSKPETSGYGDSLKSLAGGTAAWFTNRIVGLETRDLDYWWNIKKQSLLITPEIANLLMLRKKIPIEIWEQRMNAGGYAVPEAKYAYDALKPYPAIPDIISWARYNSPIDMPHEKAYSKHDISEADWEVWEWLSRMKLTTEQVQSLFKRGVMTTDEADTELARLGWIGLDRHYVKSLAWSLPNPMLLTQGDLLAGKSKESILNDISAADIHPTYAETYLDGILTKPSSQDIVAYQLRIDPYLGGLDDELRKTGIHPNYFPLYKALANPIPPVNDIITMAVREAFTPEIARRFGQYEGLPPEYVDWVQKKGLTRDWAERYWAAHWTLPSVQQGFSMLHRGIINEADLNLLLRALDIMPYWREKLIDLSYKPLTRVDVRRMHLLGTLDEAGVMKAYRDVGYSDYNADKMRDFTVRYNRRAQSRFSPSDVITGYVNGFIEEAEARTILAEIGTKSTEIPTILKLAGHKRDWKNKTERIDAIENLYKKGKKSEDDTRTILTELGISEERITVLFEQWEARVEADKIPTWTAAQTLSFLKKKLITQDRATQELDLLGYDEEHINVFLASVTGET